MVRYSLRSVGLSNFLRFPLCVVVFTWLILNTVTANSEIIVRPVQSEFADFAINPETGTIAAVDIDNHSVSFFKSSDLKAQEPAPTSTVRVGTSPYAIFYKKFGSVGVFAVVCTQDSNMYLLRADTDDSKPGELGLFRTIPLDVVGVSSVMGSINPDDPFIYYCYGSGRESACGVVSLRDMKNHGMVLKEFMDGAISASGEVAYRRGPFSPSGFESLKLSSAGLELGKPSFSPFLRDHRDTQEYVPDPFGRLTVTGQAVFDLNLEKRLGELKFKGYAFLRKPATILGSGDNGHTLQAASYNTLGNVGKKIAIPPASSKNAVAVSRGISNQGDFKRLTKRLRILVDEKHGQIHVGHLNQIVSVPISDLELPDEPHLIAKIKGTEKIIVNQPNKLIVEVDDPRVSVSFDDLPDGMVVEGNQILWTPSINQLGTVSLLATLKANDIQKPATYELKVRTPSIGLPFSPNGIKVSADESFAVIWEGYLLDEYGRVQANAEAKNGYRIAVVDLKNGKTRVERQVAEPPSYIVAAEERLFVLLQSSGTKLEVLNVQTLERENSITVSGPILSIDRLGSKLVVANQERIEVYDAKTLSKLKQFVISNEDRIWSLVSSEGLRSQGVIYDENFTPQLIQSPNPIAVIDNSQQALRFLQENRDLPNPKVPQNGRTRAATAQISASNIKVDLDYSLRQVDVPGVAISPRSEIEVVVTESSGSFEESHVILRELSQSIVGGYHQIKRPLLALSNGKAYVAYGPNLYRWTLSLPNDRAHGPSIALVKKQTEVALSEQETTTLKHSALGGKAPIEYSLKYESEGVKIDKETGTVTLDNKVIKSKAIKFLAQGGNFYGSDPGWNDANSPLFQKSVLLLGRKPKGVAVALSIGVTATDADLTTNHLVYFIIVEVPADDWKKEAAKLEKANQDAIEAAAKQNQANINARTPKNNKAPTRNSDDPSPDSAASTAELRKRIESLENRVDLLTRQLNELLKQLNKE